MDEPTSDLSSSYIKLLVSLINDLKRSGRAIIVASNNTNFIAKIADLVYVLKDGSIIGYGRTEDILYNEELLVEADLEPPAYPTDF